MIWPIICIISNYNLASSPPKIPGGVKETYFHNQGLWFIKLSPIENVKTRFQKEWYLYFHSLCTICHKKLCVFLPKRKDDWNDMMGYNLGKYTEKTNLHKDLWKDSTKQTKVRKESVNVSPSFRSSEVEGCQSSYYSNVFQLLDLERGFLCCKVS